MADEKAIELLKASIRARVSEKVNRSLPIDEFDALLAATTFAIAVAIRDGKLPDLDAVIEAQIKEHVR